MGTGLKEKLSATSQINRTQELHEDLKLLKNYSQPNIVRERQGFPISSYSSVYVSLLFTWIMGEQNMHVRTEVVQIRDSKPEPKISRKEVDAIKEETNKQDIE